jgi:KDO2-lipid IV(A) lauroyltransferase
LPRLWLGRPVKVRMEGAQYVDEAISTGKGLLFLTPHLGCFEVLGQAYADLYGQNGQRPMTVLFRPPRQAWLAKLVIASRARPGLATAPTSLAGVKQMLKALKGGGCVGLLPDQVPPQSQGLWTPFFGKDAYTMTLSARLATQTGATVLVAWGQRLSWGRGYVVHVSALPEPLTDQLQPAVAQINLAMQSLIQQSPGQYLWGYARYKSPREWAP